MFFVRLGVLTRRGTEGWRGFPAMTIQAMPKRSSALLIVLIGGAVLFGILLIVGVGGYFIWKLQESKGSGSPQAEQVVDDGSPLPDAATMENLAATKPVTFLQYCNIRYQRE